MPLKSKFWNRSDIFPSTPVRSKHTYTFEPGLYRGILSGMIYLMFDAGRGIIIHIPSSSLPYKVGQFLANDVSRMIKLSADEVVILSNEDK